MDVIFSLNSERKIEVHTIASRDMDVRSYLKKNLGEKQILYPSLMPGVKYNLLVRLEIKH